MFNPWPAARRVLALLRPPTPASGKPWTPAATFPDDREPITDRTLRRLLESLVWEDQRALWAELRLSGS
jgi:hypothetical protein